MIQTDPDPIVLTTDEDYSNQSSDTKLEEREPAPDAVREQDGAVAVWLAVGERMDKLESNIRKLITKMSQINVEILPLVIGESG